MRNKGNVISTKHAARGTRQLARLAAARQARSSVLITHEPAHVSQKRVFGLTMRDRLSLSLPGTDKHR